MLAYWAARGLRQLHIRSLAALSVLSDPSAAGSRTHQGHRVHWQGYSTKPDRRLRSGLRQLYKRVHPDLFTEYPAEKVKQQSAGDWQVQIKPARLANLSHVYGLQPSSLRHQLENERSFKLLQEYLRQAEEGDPGHPAARTPYHFCFYLRDALPDFDSEEETSDDASGSEESASAAEELQCIKLSLPPPPPAAHDSGQLAAATRKGLLKLLHLCGVLLPAADGEELLEEEEDDGIGSRHLSRFLAAAAEVVRRSESGQPSWEVRVANLRGALRLLRQVVVGFNARDFSGPRQVELLEQVALALDRLPGLDFSGLHLLLGHRTALDSQGHLCLDAAEGVEEWTDFLGGVDLEFARHRRQLAARVRGMEQQAAAAAGLGMVFTAAGSLMSHTYREFLERLISHAAVQGRAAVDNPYRATNTSSSSSSIQSGPGPPPMPPPSLIPLYVTPVATTSSSSSSGAPSSQAQGSQDSAGFSLHQGFGYIQVPMTATAPEVYSWVQTNAAAACAILAAKQKAEQQVKWLTTHTRQRLRLRRLLKDELLEQQQYEAACKRLLHFREELQQHLEGLSLRVAFANRVVPGAHLVEIAWNFEL